MTGNPARAEDVRRRVQHALDHVCRTATDLLRRYTDQTSGAYEAPNEVIEGGDVHGLIASGSLQVLQPLEDVIEAARRDIAAVQAEIDAYQRDQHGEHWRPVNAARRPPPEGVEAT